MMKKERPCRRFKGVLWTVFVLILVFGRYSAALAEAPSKPPVPSKWGYENFKEYMPDLRKQGSFGTCWAFSAVAMAEINLGLQGKMNRPNLSEVQLAYFYYYWQTDPLGGTAGDSNQANFGPGEDYLQAGGSLKYAARILATWTGLARGEGVLKYPSDAESIQQTIDPRYAYTGVARLRAYYVTDLIPTDPASMEEAKRIIMETGSLGVQFHARGFLDGIYNAQTNAYHDYATGPSNHAVTIVGWDDHFSKENFIFQPPGDGAWLVRNSFAAGSYEDNQNFNGYFWMSYYNASLQRDGVGYVFDTADRYDNNYQYDGSAWIDAVEIPLDTCHSANIFRAQAADSEDLAAASFYSETIGGEYTIRVYVSDTPMGNNPESGTLKAVKTGIIPHAGYHTADLDSPVELKRGQYFSIVLTVYNGNKDMVAIARERTSTSNKLLNSIASAQPGQSFFRIGNQRWQDISSSVGKGNMCIKAFTRNKAVPPEDPPADDPEATEDGEASPENPPAGVPETPEDKAAPTETPPEDIPKTGDSAPLALWAAMTVLGMIGLGTLALPRNRRK